MTPSEARAILRGAADRLDGFPATELGQIYEAWATLHPGMPMPSYRDDDTGADCLDLSATLAAAEA